MKTFESAHQNPHSMNWFNCFQFAYGSVIRRRKRKKTCAKKLSKLKSDTHKKEHDI